MKKLLTALLVVVMMLSLCGAAFAFSDTADLSKDAQGSVAKLSGLNIISGYPDGTFKPANNITRAEFAKIACVTGGMEASAEVLNSSPSKFSDVKAGEWYTGFVNLANSQGWVKGFPDGTFRPNAKISYAEVITVLTRLVGYNDNLPGPWPVDYIAKAGSLDITEGVSFDANGSATRGDVAVMADSTLDCTIVEWDNDTEDFEEDADETTLMEDNFDAAVNDDYYISAAKFDDDTWSIEIQATDADDDDLADFDKTTPNAKWYDLADNVVVSDGSLPTGLGSKIANILYNDDDEVIQYIDVTSTQITVDGEDWEYSGGEYTIDDEDYDMATWTVPSIKTTGFDETFVYRAYLDEDNEVYKVSERKRTSPAIVDEYKESTNKVTFKENGTYQSDLEDIDFDDDDVLIQKGSAFIEPKDLAENDIVYVDKGSSNAYGYDWYIDVYTLSKTGKYDAVKTGEIKIDGTWYDVAGDNFLSRDNGDEFEDSIGSSGLEDTKGDTITYFINKSNQVCIVLSDADGTGSDDSSTIYGVVTSITTSSGGSAASQIEKIKVMKKDGSVSSYSLDTDEVELDYSAIAAATNDLDVDDFVKFSVNDNNDIDSLTVLAYFAEGANAAAAGTVGKPSTLASLDSDYYDTDNNEYVGSIIIGDSDNNRIKFTNGDGTTSWYDITDETVIFNGDLDEAWGVDDDEVDVEDNSDFADWAEKIPTGTSYTAYVQYDGGDVEYIYVNTTVSGSDADYAIVNDLYETDKDEWWVEVNINGTDTEYELKGSHVGVVEGALYEYSITSNKFDVATTDIRFDPKKFAQGLDAVANTVAAFNGAVDPATLNDNDPVVPGYQKFSVYQAVYCEVTDVTASKKLVEINGFNFYADDDTIIYDYSDWYDDGDDPKYLGNDVSQISEDDYIIYIDNDDEENIAEYFIIVNNIDDYEDSIK